ncbi:MAG: sensor histidine kinase, partial [Trebonia sp.]
AGPAAAGGFVSAYLVFAVLPLLAGRHVAAQRNAAARAGQRERLEIARAMHDSLGRRLSLAALQTSALEVADLPEQERATVARLGNALRATVTELHEIVGALRAEGPPARRVASIGTLVGEFRAAGAVVSFSSSGAPRPLPPPADEAAYRVIEEGLTNAVRHAPGRPVSVGVTVTWEKTGLRLAVDNQASGRAYVPGSGLTDLAGRVRDAGGELAHQVADGTFMLRAVLPTVPSLPAGPAEPGRPRPGQAALGMTVGILLLVVLPAAVLLGVA